MIRSAVCVALVLSASCGNKKEGEPTKAAEPAKPAGPPAGYVAHPNHPTLFLQVPADAKPVDNTFGVGWFANADKSFAITYKPRGSDDPSMAALKTTIGDQVDKWLKEETTPDGFILTFIKKGETDHGLQMRRMIGGAPWSCAAGTIKDEAGLDVVIKACNSIRI